MVHVSMHICQYCVGLDMHIGVYNYICMHVGLSNHACKQKISFYVGTRTLFLRVLRQMCQNVLFYPIYDDHIVCVFVSLGCE